MAPQLRLHHRNCSGRPNDDAAPGHDPEDVLRTLALSTATCTKMVQNLIWATGYKVIALPLASGFQFPIGITLSPAVGALLMSASTVIVACTVIVAINAMTLRRVKLT